MKKGISKKTYVRFADYDMAAYLYLNPEDKETGEPFTKAEILQILKDQGVVYGIREKVIDHMLSSRIYQEEILIANGLEPADGEDGEFEFKFNRKWNKKLETNVDGSINYWRISVVDLVVQGQTIVLYNPPTKGTKGYTVKGKEIYGKTGRELSPLRGKGFERSKDNLIYTSLINGKIEYKNDRIYITELYESFGNIDGVTGDIDFKGDIIVHGNIDSGITIHATGSIIVDGTVGSSKLIAGKDIILRSGISGGYIKSSKSIFTKYLDSSTAEAAGSIHANNIFKSRVWAGDKIIVAGKKGSIAGGEVRGIDGVEASSLGNKDEIETKVFAGVSKDIYQWILTLRKKMEETEEKIRAANEAIKELEEENKNRPVAIENEPRMMLWLQARMKNVQDYRAYGAEMEELEALVEKAKDTYIKVETKVYPETVLAVNEREIRIKETRKSFVFKSENERSKHRMEIE